MERFKNPKFIASLVVATLAIIVFLQNRAAIDLQVLWLAKVTTTVSTALVFAFLAGVVSGALAFSRWKTQRERAKTARAEG